MTVGAVELTELPLERLRTEVALVTQEHHVFRGSVRDNVQLAREGAGEGEVWRALATVDADRWVQALPRGLDTVLGSGHQTLTPAQAQQIIGAESSTVSCIAGALEQDQQMLAALEDQPNGVVLTDSADADSYASLIMGCASPGEMLDQMVAALPTFGYGTYEIGCFEQQASVLTSADWEEFIRIVVQPDRMSELEPLLGELTFC